MAKRRGRWRAASVRSRAAGARARSEQRGAGARRAQRGAQTCADGGDPTAAPPHPRLRPSAHRPATPPSPPRTPGSRWRPRPGRPGALGACCPGRRCCSWGRCCPSSPRRGLQVRAARAGPPGSPRLLTAALSTSAHHPPRLSLWGHRPALCRLRVLSLTCASSSLTGQGSEARRGRGVRAPAVPPAGGGSGDAVGAGALGALSSNLASGRPGLGRLEPSDLPREIQAQVGRGQKSASVALPWGWVLLSFAQPPLPGVSPAPGWGPCRRHRGGETCPEPRGWPRAVGTGARGRPRVPVGTRGLRGALVLRAARGERGVGWGDAHPAPQGGGWAPTGGALSPGGV